MQEIADHQTIKDFSILMGNKIDCDDRYDRMANFLGMNRFEKESSIPKNRARSIEETIQNYFLHLAQHEKNYLEVFSAILSFVKEMKSAKYDLDLLRSNSDFCKFDAFLDDLGNCEAPKYNNTNSSTGRLTVLEGPNVLTANASFKSALVSSYQKGQVVQIDVVSAEPKIAWLEAGNSPVKDVYQALATEEFENLIDRSAAKKAVLCALYGQSAAKLQEQLPKTMHAIDVIEATRRRLGYRNLLERLQKSEKISNAFGRPLRVSNSDQGPLIVSHYLQSTAAEACILAFKDFCSRFSGSCDPIYIIHDALIVDCNEQLSERLKAGTILKLKGGPYSMHAVVEPCGRSKNEI